MPGPRQAMTPQALTRSLAAHLRASLRTVEIGEMVSQGLDGGREFTFTAVCRDGSEMIVSVMQTKASPQSQKSTPRVSQVLDVVAARQAAIAQKAFEAMERRRKRFLGEAL